MHEDLEPIANLKFGLQIEEISRKSINALRELMSSDVGGGSAALGGPLEMRKFNLRLDGEESKCRMQYDIWLDLILRKYGAITRDDIDFIMSRVERCTAAAAQNASAASGTLAASKVPIGFSSALAQHAERRMQHVASELRRQLEIRIREQEAFPAKLEPKVATNEMFVIIAARPELTPFLKHAALPAILDNRLDPFVMAEREPEDGSITSSIMTHLEKAKLLTADLTFERPNCYYEAGYAHAKSKKVIFSAREDHNPRREGRQSGDPKVHFDLDNHRFTFWREGHWENVREELRERISEALLLLGTSAADRQGKAGEREIHRLMSVLQEGRPASLVFSDQALAQELGWSIVEVQSALKRLQEKGRVIQQSAGGYSLKN